MGKKYGVTSTPILSMVVNFSQKWMNRGCVREGKDVKACQGYEGNSFREGLSGLVRNWEMVN